MQNVGILEILTLFIQIFIYVLQDFRKTQNETKRLIEHVKMSKRIGSDYLPLVNQEIPNYRIVISFSKIAWFTVSLPFFGFIFCIFWSVLYNFEHSTSTHCRV